MNKLFDRFIHFPNTFYSRFDVKSKVKDDRTDVNQLDDKRCVMI